MEDHPSRLGDHGRYHATQTQLDIAAQTSDMTSDSNTQWQSLRKGDKIQIVRIPTEMSAPHYHNGDFDDLLDLYAHLIASAEVLTIDQIDDDGRPWVEYNWIARDGDASHSLAVDDDSWVRAS